ncbi:MAG: GNAT family N-acetyltransferase [Anaerolineaceae bacterium]|nr:GNAT family N-acetyltransferase [Anaerolineaceae bacterium]
MLYYNTVHQVNTKDYTDAQINAWAPRVYSNAYWQRRFKRYTVYVAEENGVIAGFAEFEPTGHLDCFYVHHAWQRQGVGGLLLKRIEANARQPKITRLFADVSVTALPFFKAMGFRVVRKQKKIYRGQSFQQYVMEKRGIR